MNKEIAMMVCITSGVGLFALGGFRWKWMRRFLMPSIFGLMAFLCGFEWYLCVAYAVAQAITLCLPYGDRTPYWLKAVVFGTYALPSMLLGFTIWQVFVFAGSFGLFVLSNLDKSAKSFPWKICESGMGFLLGATIAHILTN